MKKFVLAIMVLAIAAAMPSAQAQHFHVLHEFQDGPFDGASPGGALVRDQAGNLYGTTGHGGLNQNGVVYKIDPAGAESVLFSFDGTNGAGPFAGLVLDQAGNVVWHGGCRAKRRRCNLPGLAVGRRNGAV